MPGEDAAPAPAVLLGDNGQHAGQLPLGQGHDTAICWRDLGQHGRHGHAGQVGGRPQRRRDAAAGEHGHGAAPVQPRVLVEDRVLKLLKLAARLQATGLNQPRAGPIIDVERVQLPSAPVQPEHQLRRQVLAGRLSSGSGLEFRDDLAVPPAGEFGIEQFLDHDKVRVLHGTDIGPRGARLDQVHEDRAPPHAERAAQLPPRGLPVAAGGMRSAPFGVAGEQVHVDAARLDVQQVPGRVGEQHGRVGATAVAGQHVPQARRRILQHLPRGRRNTIGPEGFQQFARRHHPVGSQQQHAQHRALLDAAQRHDRALVNDFQRTQDVELHVASPHPRRSSPATGQACSRAGIDCRLDSGCGGGITVSTNTVCCADERVRRRV